MCARYTIRELVLLARALGITLNNADEEFDERPKFNAAPAQKLPVVRLTSEGRRVMDGMKWGFVPSWTKGKPKFAPINAKSETAASNAMFRSAFDRRRCLVPADGFYEPKGPKTLKYRPWYFFQLRDAAPFAFGGIWERWKSGPDAESVDTFTILTTSPNEIVGQCHDRMPLILHQEAYARWLDPQVNGKGVSDLLVPYPPDDMTCWRVDDRAKRSDNDDPKLIAPVTESPSDFRVR